MSGDPLLIELGSVAEQLLERHLASTREWHPHELVPWSRGRDFEAGYQWSPDECDMDDAVRSALYLNLLTEDNLPYYFRDIERMFGREHAWGEWVRRWTAEEGRHSCVIRDYLTITRAVDPVALEVGRMAQVQGGHVPEPVDAAHGLAYVSLQELATRLSHFNTGKALTDEAGRRIMSRVAADENLHFLFYRDAAKAALDVDPSAMMIAIDDEVRRFAMPGTGIPGFAAHSAAIAGAGIYDTQIHYEQILVPVVERHWDIGHLEGLTPAAEQARERCVGFIAKVGRVLAKRAERAARVESAALTPA